MDRNTGLLLRVRDKVILPPHIMTKVLLDIGGQIDEKATVVHISCRKREVLIVNKRFFWLPGQVNKISLELVSTTAETVNLKGVKFDVVCSVGTENLPESL